MINTQGGFVASTHDVANGEFLAGGDLTFSGNSNAAIINAGKIGVDNGDVYLIARQVTNSGTITAPKGEVGLVGATQVLLKASGTDKISILPASLSGSVDNTTTGAIKAATASLKAVGGNEYALAINNGGIIRADGVEKIDGKVILFATNGKTKNTGTIIAKNKDGKGGFIETSGNEVELKGTILTGEGGEWLIDPMVWDGTSVAISTLQDQLNSGDASYTATTSITLDEALSWTGTGTLTLTCTAGTITLNGDISAANGGLTLAGGTINANSAVSVKNFTLTSGTWTQLNSTLPSFTATNFVLNGGTFLRATGGDGSVATPYLLTDIYGVQGVGSPSNSLLSKSFTLANNIDASGTQYWNSGSGFVPIGDDTNNYTGTFDGGSYTIDGLYINRSSTNYVGLFGYVGSGGVIKNVGLTNVDITGNNTIGGLVGYGYEGTISNCYATGSVTGGSSGVGGLVGGSYEGTISNCYATASVTGSGNMVGGLAGGNGTGTISYCYATGSVSGNNQVGGLVGSNSTGTISYCYATGAVTGSSYVGGLVGYMDDVGSGSITSCYFATGADGTNQSAGVGYGSSSGVEGKTLAQMKVSSNFSGWDFSVGGTWGVGVSSINSGTPYFQWDHPYLTLNASDQSVEYGSTINTTGTLGTTYTVSGLKTGDFANTLTGITLSVSGSNVNVGTTNAITASSSSATYTSSGGTTYVILIGSSGTETITTRAISISASASSTYGTTVDLNGVSYTITSGSLASGDTLSSLNLSSTTTATATSSAGTYALNTTYSNSNYAITITGGTLTINPAALSITASGTSTYGSTDLSGASYTITSGSLQNSDTLASLGLTASSTLAASTGAGTYSSSVTATSTNGNYTITFTSGSLTINPALVTITANSGSSVFSTTPTNPGFSVSGLVNGDTLSSLGLCTTDFNIDSTTAIGSYTVSVHGDKFNNNYTVSLVDGTWTVNPNTPPPAVSTQIANTTASLMSSGLIGVGGGSTGGGVTTLSGGSGSGGFLSGTSTGVSNGTGTLVITTGSPTTPIIGTSFLFVVAGSGSSTLISGGESTILMTGGVSSSSLGGGIIYGASTASVGGFTSSGNPDRW